MTAADFQSQFQMYQSPYPGKVGLSQPRSSYLSMEGKEIVIFWGFSIVVIIGLLVALKFLYSKK